MRALSVQWIAILLVLCVAYPYFVFEKISGLPWNFLVWVIGLLACCLSVLVKQAFWWWFIHFFFAPLFYFFFQLHLPPIYFLLAFLFLFLIFKGCITHQVPLFLSNLTTLKNLEDFIQKEYPQQNAQKIHLADLGAGIGSVVLYLAKRFPNIEFYAIENAPLSFWIGKLRCRKFNNIHWQMHNFAHQNLNHFDLVYVFLSPNPMPSLWIKAKKEMKKNALLVSCTFAIPNANAFQIVDEESPRPLFCYRL